MIRIVLILEEKIFPLLVDLVWIMETARKRKAPFLDNRKNSVLYAEIEPLDTITMLSHAKDAKGSSAEVSQRMLFTNANMGIVAR
jgi:hypothetical protein